MDRHLQGLISYLSGYAAEKKALCFLKKKGYRLLCRNFSPKRGLGANELDLIMLDEGTIVFIEVKKRNSLVEAMDVVDARLQRRLFKGAQFFLASNPEYENKDCRFDVVFIVPNEKPVHLQNVIEG